MFQSIRDATEVRLDRFRADGGRRAAALAIAIVLELLLLALLFSLGYSSEPEGKPEASVVEFTASDAEDEATEPEPADESPRSDSAPVPPQPQVPAEPLPPTPLTAPPPPAAVLPTPVRVPPPPPSPPQATPPPPQPARPGVRMRTEPMGPPGSAGASAGDTQRVGTAPNGEPLYAAAWYREPTDDELAGYLSTATGPGWGLIACRTAPDFRVEDCVAIDEYPNGSNMNRAVLAAAWQFRVRPPRRGGQSLVGAWVRIRITYEMREAR
ncbi:MAG: hypothetical protein B7Z08_10890 [Sphingomonadales bacterium 32-68-7]|nr:MAG: hypothetical protein B7Z33_10835 [Sphingomonadales bacterium 12-68-11]OYX08079.1 MAG: hypothetical protein B7Z08_10890 [Sphingomonadales bacterium 32-68-7]